MVSLISGAGGLAFRQTNSKGRGLAPTLCQGFPMPAAGNPADLDRAFPHSSDGTNEIQLPNTRTVNL
ncbi:hypothetical protein ACSSV1_006406 [Labrenzia sp. MBR-25]|jgi:hypothetical protein